MADQISLPSVVMIRHAQNTWNREGRFTGWADPALTAQGRAEAQRAGERLLIASHGNTLRALIMALHGMRVDEVEAFEMPTGVPIVSAFTPKGEPIGWHDLNDDRRAA